jgi:hypothetical protein
MRPRRSLAGVLFILPILVVLLTTSLWTAPSPGPSVDGATDGTSKAARGAEANEGFTLAVVRRDSIAIPFATYDGRRWKNTWPAPETRVTAPIMLADVPKRWWTGRDPILKWTFWPIEPAEAPAGDPVASTASATASRTLETIGPTWFPAHCQQSLGLRTTYSSREVLPPLHAQPYPKAGLAVGGDATITPIEIVDIASSELVDALARTLVTSVFNEETRLIKNYIRAGVGWTHPYTDDERKETPFRIEALYKVARGLGDRDVYYYEGLKHYAVRDPASPSSKSPSSKSSSNKSRQPEETRASAATSQNLQSTASPQSSPTLQSSQSSQSAQPTQATQPAAADGGGPGKEPCDLVTFVSGWLIGRQDELLKDKERITPMQVNVTVTSCDFASAYIMLPLGVVRVKDKALWAVQWSGWTHEHYTVLEVKDDLVATLVTTDGGYCPKR